jgi:hypothetical protein
MRAHLDTEISHSFLNTYTNKRNFTAFETNYVNYKMNSGTKINDNVQSLLCLVSRDLNIILV